MIYIIIVQVLIVFVLLTYNMYVNRNLKAVKASKENLNRLQILKKLVNITGNHEKVSSKLSRINEVILKELNIDYSTIVYYNGREYVVKASNVDSETIYQMLGLEKLEIFKESINNRIEKYIVAQSDEDFLPYLDKKKKRAESCVFFPLYNDDMFAGYWIIESKKKFGFDHLDQNILYTVKDSILSIISTLGYEKSLETFVRVDEFTNLNSNEYMLTEGKRRLERHESSVLTMVKVNNILEVNERYSREAGNTLIKIVGEKLAEKCHENIVVRYFGPKFMIAFEGEKAEHIEEKIVSLKNEIENTPLFITKDGKVINVTNIESNVKNLGYTLENLNDSTINALLNSSPEDIKKVLEENIENNDLKNSITEDEKIKVYPEITVVSCMYYKGTELDMLSKNLEENINSIEENIIEFII